MKKRPHFLIIRTSSLADVALSLRVVYPMVRMNPHVRFTFLMKPSITGILVNAPSNLEAMVIDLDNTDKSIVGLFRFSRKLLYERFSGVIDLERSKRSRYITHVLRTYGRVKTYRISRPEALHRQSGDHISFVESERYLHAFEACFQKAGLLQESLSYHEAVMQVPIYLGREDAHYEIGLVPFSKADHSVANLDAALRTKAILKESFSLNSVVIGLDKSLSEKIRTTDPLPKDVYPYVSFYEELSMLSRLRMVVGVDSSRLQMAQLVGVPVVYLQEMPQEKKQIESYILTPFRGLEASVNK